ncbi:hypothetical protein ATANTOWER_018516 [Ataeniobius toweri]|uniref:Uncharacterized protein n=1 Tax=Ataeniobius toweri TaxID=208326 RepID=A0ABU7AUK5_9TELE|nr:hypothetical protein [Ataeniobius toweri]
MAMSGTIVKTETLLCSPTTTPNAASQPNTVAAEHLEPSSCPALTSRQLNLADGKRAQSGEKSVPDDFLLLCSPLLGADTPSPPQPSSKCASVLRFPPFAAPPHLPPPLALLHTPISPDTQTPSHHSVAHVISGACLASPSHLTSHPHFTNAPLPTTHHTPPTPPHPTPTPTPTPPEHSSLTNHTGFRKSFKVYCLWEPLVSMQHFSI